MKKIAGFVLAIINVVNLYSQNSIAINGFVKDDKDSTVLPFVNIYLKETSIGTVSNKAGHFIFHVPNEFKNSLICFKTIGYQPVEIKVNVLHKDTAIILLHADTLSIPEIIVLPAGITAESIMCDAIKQIPKNFSRKQCYFDAFYREMALNENEYTRLIEAAVEIQDFGFDSENTKRRIKIVEFRKSNDYIKRDFITKLSKLFFADDNELIWTINTLDYVKQMFQNKNVILNTFNHVVVGITKYDNQEVYIVESHKKTSGMFDDYMSFYINKSDKAFVQIEFHRRLNPKLKDKDQEFYEKNKNVIVSNTITKYIKTNDFYYLNFIQADMPFDLSQGEKEGMQKQCYHKEIMINNVYTERKQYSRIKNKEALKVENDLYNLNYEYDPVFWNNYNILLINPIVKKAKSDLSTEKDIEEQFIDNGK